MYFGSIPVPAVLQPFLPYAKFIVSLAALAASLVVAVVAAPPAIVYVILAAANALGVVMIPNVQIDAVLQDGIAAVKAGEAAVTDARAGNAAGVRNDVTTAWGAVQDGVQGAEHIYREL